MIPNLLFMNQRDHLQNYINLFSNCSKAWQLNVSTHKCVVLNTIILSTITPPKYILNDYLLPIVENIKDLIEYGVAQYSVLVSIKNIFPTLIA